MQASGENKKTRRLCPRLQTRRAASYARLRRVLGLGRALQCEMPCVWLG